MDQLPLISGLCDKTAKKDPEALPVRLSVLATVQVKDNWTGEAFSTKIPLEFEEGEKVGPSVTEALSSARLQNQVEAFSKYRSSYNG